MSVDPIMCVQAQKKFNGTTRSEILNHQGDHTGSAQPGFITCESGMPEDNPFKSDKQRKFLYAKKPAIAKKIALDSRKAGK